MDKEVQIPCGGCIGCRLEYSRQWALRCVAEASMYEKNCFVTLTYNDDYLPKDLSLQKRDLLLFLKRLRRDYVGIRYFSCGEYGDSFDRPHYHLCLFNWSFDDLEEIRYEGPKNPFSKFCKEHKQAVNQTAKLLNVQQSPYESNNGVMAEFRLYRSPTLEKLWDKGFSTIGQLSFETAAYVARYVVKKIKGKNSEEYYDGRQPEFCLMSRKPGIGKAWFDKWRNDVLNIDGVAKNRLTFMPPKYYDTIVKNEDPDKFKKIKERRKKKWKELTPETLARREKFAYIKLSKCKRSYEK